MELYTIENLTIDFKKIKICNNKSVVFHRSRGRKHFKLYTKIRIGTDIIVSPINTITEIQFNSKKKYCKHIILVNISQDVATIINKYLQNCCDICNKRDSLYTANIGQAALYLCQKCLLLNIFRLTNI
jgi:hypothetical protein